MIGIDVVEINRFRKMTNLEMFLSRAFTQGEVEYFISKKSGAKGFYASIAGHFAAKEAFSKALGTGVRGFSMSDIEVCHDELGKPYLKFGGVAVNGTVTISHSDIVAVAAVYMSDEVPNIGLPLYKGMDFYNKLLPYRADDANKGNCGKVFIVGGSRGMTGAPCMTAMAALRMGSGLVTVGVPESEREIVAIKLTEAMTVPLKELPDNGTVSREALGEITSRLKKSDVCVFGPGLGQNDDIQTLLDSLISGSVDFLIDADGLNAIAKDLDILRKHNNRQSCKIVITPHPGEMARLCGKSIEDVQNNRLETASNFATEFGVIVVLKGKDTVIASPDGKSVINQSGNAGMATGGTGDVLSGVIASLMGQGLKPFDAAVLGAFVHGVAGDFAKRDMGEMGMIAGDVIKNLPKAVRLIENVK